MSNEMFWLYGFAVAPKIGSQTSDSSQGSQCSDSCNDYSRNLRPMEPVINFKRYGS